MTGPRVAIVGGGILGMTAALELAERGHQVVLLDAGAALGGLVASHTIGDFVWDRFYHVILPQDTETLGLIDRLGLTDQLRWQHTRTGFYVDGRWHSLSTSWEYLRFSPLGWIDKLRLGVTILRAAGIRNGVPLEPIPVTKWLRRWSGEATYRRIWLPLLRSKLGENYHRASAAFIWAYIRRLYAARTTTEKREVMGYVAGGYAKILEALSTALRRAGVEIRVGCQVTAITPSAAGVTIGTTGGSIEVDHAVLTVPMTAVPTLCPWMTSAEITRANRVTYQGVICASVLLKRPLEGFYVANITDDGLPFTTIVEMTGLVDRAAFGGHSLIYLPRYATQDDDWWTKPDSDIEAAFLAGVERMVPSFRRSDVVAFRVARARAVQAVSTLHYSRDVAPPIRTSDPRVHLINTAQIINGTLNVHETVGLARRHVAQIAAAMATIPTIHRTPVETVR